jgi:hypothetical protein
MSEVEQEITTVSSLAEAIKHVDVKAVEAQQKVELFKKNFHELTGYEPHHQMNAMDVLKLVLKVYGEPKA